MRWPSRRNAVLGLSGTSLGALSAAASVANSPYDKRRPVGGCTTVLFSVVQLDTSTPQRLAAASTNRWRAVAPAVRRPVQAALIEPLPPATWRVKLTVSRGAWRTITRDQSASSSSATIMGMAVLTPWPTSGLGDTIVMVPSGAIWIYAFIETGSTSSLSAAARSCSASQLTPTSMPPPATADTLIKERRSKDRLCWLFITIWLF